MRTLKCVKCTYEKPRCEFYKKHRSPPICSRCIQGRPPKPSDGLGKVHRQRRPQAHRRRRLAQKGNPIGKPRYPHHHRSEFEVQALIWNGLRGMGYDVRGEVKQKEHGRFDLVVFDETKAPIRIVEVKRDKVKPTASQEQIDYYRRFNTPLDFVSGWKQAEKYLESWANGPPSPMYEPRKES